MKIAIVEDDINMRKSLEIALKAYEAFEVKTFRNAVTALDKLDESYDLVVTDITMPKMDGIEFLTRLDNRYEAIVITADATLGRAVEALRLGAKDFLTKPFEIEDLVKAINRSYKVKTKLQNRPAANSFKKPKGFEASSQALDKALRLAKKAAASDATILLQGESGVGKEVFADFIHKNSPCAKNKFVAINMAAIPDNLIESELFGFEKGAFTDAEKMKKGLFEEANGGTLFLDEIAEMPYGVQAKLLRALQEKKIQRLGSNKPIDISVRVVSATNADIEQKIKDGAFRQDLFYRLNTIPITIAPLRQRTEEIEPLAQGHLKRICEKHGLQEKKLGKEALEAMLGYNWPGNIRELLSVVERAAILSEDKTITKQDLFLDSRL
ncbi:MAG: sigma-54-dependent transcriptional regulator [Campylobacterota bacterium]